MSNKSLQELWELIKLDDVHAFEQLYRYLANDLLHYGKSLTPREDLAKEELQNLFLYIWHNRKTIQNPTHIRSYLFRAFRNNLLKSTTDSKKVIQLDDEIDVVNIDPEDHSQDKPYGQHIDSIKKVIDVLPERQKEVVKMRYFHGLDHQEIADVLQINYQSVSNLLARAIKKIRKNINFK